MGASLQGLHSPMANIHFSLAGGGRGHAARAKTLIEALRTDHRVTVYTFGDALDLLGPAYSGTDVTIRRIEGACFACGASGSVDLVGTGLAGAGKVMRWRSDAFGLARTLEEEGADLVVTDFEPLLPQAARHVGIPTVGLDHQSAFAYGDFRELPRPLRRSAAAVGAFVVTVARARCPKFWGRPPRPQAGSAPSEPGAGASSDRARSNQNLKGAHRHARLLGERPVGDALSPLAPVQRLVLLSRPAGVLLAHARQSRQGDFWSKVGVPLRLRCNAASFSNTRPDELSGRASWCTCNPGVDRKYGMMRSLIELIESVPDWWDVRVTRTAAPSRSSYRLRAASKAVFSVTSQPG